MMTPTTSRHSATHLVTRGLRNVLLYAVVIVGLLVFCIPVYYMATTSIKAEAEVFAIPVHWIPHEFKPQNYPEAFAAAPFARYFYNSTVVAIAVVFSTLFFSALAGYGFAKFSFPGKTLFFLFVLSTLMIPFQILLIPLYVLVYHLGWTNNYAGLIIPGALTAFGVFLMRQFCLTLPDELLDAARIDGCSEPGIFWRIVLPLLKPPLASLAIITFLGSWNNFLWPLIVVNKGSLFTLPVGMTVFTQPMRAPYWTYIMAVSTVSTVPVVVVFLALQKYFIQGVVLSGMKG
ncbi:MAG: carbohydrate ABC transporter permease [Chloroflexi bacterium]|nr:carbohydrate ABC transporter permease [Chloroflexota bacterium]